MFLNHNTKGKEWWEVSLERLGVQIMADLLGSIMPNDELGGCAVV